MKNDVGLVEDRSTIDTKQIKRQLVNMDDNLIKYKRLFENLTVEKMR